MSNKVVEDNKEDEEHVHRQAQPLVEPHPQLMTGGGGGGGGGGGEWKEEGQEEGRDRRGVG